MPKADYMPKLFTVYVVKRYSDEIQARFANKETAKLIWLIGRTGAPRPVAKISGHWHVFKEFAEAKAFILARLETQYNLYSSRTKAAKKALDHYKRETVLPPEPQLGE